jgi:hypothetical protein
VTKTPVLGIRVFLGLPDPDPDPLVEVWIRIRIRILPFSHKCVERTEKMLEKTEFEHKILAKNQIF